MTKPDDIPQDVWDAAVYSAAAPDLLDDPTTISRVWRVARAILAERESGRERWAQYLEAVVKKRERGTPR